MITKEEAEKLYADLIQLRRSDVLIKSKDNLGAIEIHHIMPVSCGGLDDDSNKIALYAKEHFMAHVYLYVIHRNTEHHYQMTCALMNMHKGTLTGSRQELRDYILASEEYQLAREDFGKYCSKKLSEANLGNKNHMHGKHWYYNPETNESKPFVEGEQPNGWVLGKKQNKPNKTYRQKTHRQKMKWISSIDDSEIKLCYIDEAKQLVNTKKWKYGYSEFEKTKRSLSLKKYHANKKIQPNLKKLKEKYIFLKPLYDVYIQYGFAEVVKQFNYKYSKTNLIQLFKTYIPEYIPKISILQARKK